MPKLEVRRTSIAGEDLFRAANQWTKPVPVPDGQADQPSDG